RPRWCAPSSERVRPPASVSTTTVWRRCATSSALGPWPWSSAVRTSPLPPSSRWTRRRRSAPPTPTPSSSPCSDGATSAAPSTPGLLPGRTALADAGGPLRDKWNLVPAERGLDAAGILTAAAAGRIGCLVLLGADPLTDFPDRDLARRALAGARRIVAVDSYLT